VIVGRKRVISRRKTEEKHGRERVISVRRKNESRRMGEREKWVGEKNNKKIKVVVGVFIIIKKKLSGVGLTLAT
jgi:hypothetical protein